ncbi:sigma-70 family RNA polymerase sigma factor [Micromonospora echinofusca]|uniref:RNA polymerase sigma factor n=1 Tax=Micromonospora echinofusca TaxID=47858 RepID=UPI0033F397BA
MVDEEFREFFNTMYAPLLSFATVWGRSHHDADEALGTVMADMYGRWTDIRHPVAYARRAVTWAILKIRRDRGDDRYFPAPSDQLPDGTDEAPEFDQMEGEQWVTQLLAVLPPTQRAVLSHFLDGLSMKEISDELRKSESTIRQNFKLARDRLRPHVTEYDRRRSGPSAGQRPREENR